MSRTKVSSDRVHNFNRVTLAIDRQLQAEFEVDLLIMPEELRRNSIVAAQWHTAGDKQVCPLCTSLEGDVIPVDSPEYGRIAPPIHLNCRCILSYITARERGVQARIEKYEPIDPDLLKKWSSKVYTDAEIREMAENVSEHTVVRERLSEFTDEYKDYKVEKGVFLDVNGKEILSKTGTTNSISFTAEESKLIKNRNLFFIHNHPSGSSFSVDDLLCAGGHNFKELNVVGSKYYYRIHPKTPGKWPLTTDFKIAYEEQKIKHEAWFFANTLEIGGKSPILTRQEAWNEITHKIWQTLAKDYNLIYERTLI